MIEKWFERLLLLESSSVITDYYLCFTDKNTIGSTNYILLKNCTYVQAKKYALLRFFTNFESVYTKEEMDFSIKKCYEVYDFNSYLIYLF